MSPDLGMSGDFQPGHVILQIGYVSLSFLQFYRMTLEQNLLYNICITAQTQCSITHYFMFFLTVTSVVCTNHYCPSFIGCDIS